MIIALYFIYLTALYIPTLLSLVITILDLCLYYIIVYITYYEYKHTESSRLQSLHQKLFIENLSITAIFAYCITPYGGLLSQSVIGNIILIQISTCVLLPLVRLESVPYVYVYTQRLCVLCTIECMYVCTG